MDIKKVGVLGAGAMGTGIAQVAAQAGYDVILSDVDQKFVDNALGRISTILDKSVEKGKMTAEQKDEIMVRFIPQVGVEGFSDVDLVIEAVIEDLDVKRDAFAKLDSVCKPEAILTTNTSSMSITIIAAATNRQEKVAGMHFFNPAPVMRLVEVIRGFYSNDETINTVSAAARKMGKTTVEVKKDVPGFVVNRIMTPQFLEAIRLVEEGIASPEDIDTAVKLGLNYPMGPFELMDYTGVDIGVHVMNYLYNESKDMRWNPPQTVKAMIRAGRLGRKTGAGWYKYEK